MLSERNLLLIAIVAAICAVGVLKAAPQKSTKAPNISGALLGGTIRSAGGSPLEGVTVSAKSDGKTISTTVFTDEAGAYIFPPLDKGTYRVWAQAVGFDTGRARVEWTGAQSIHQDFVLKTADDPTRQMTGSDWFATLPDDTVQERRVKDVLKTSCTGCHQTSYILQNRFDKAGWLAIINLMKMVNVYGTYLSSRPPWPIIEYHKEQLADYLAKARGPSQTAKLKFLPRPKGEAALAVITEYDIEPAETPGEHPLQDGSDWSEGVPSSLNGVRGTHDAEIDFSGNIWVVNSTDNPNRTYAKIDAKTGEVTSYKAMDSKGKVRTSHGIRKDQNGVLWFNLSGEAEGEGELGSLARLDPMTGKLDVYTPPKGMSGVGGAIDVDGKGKIWASTRGGGIRFDPDTGKFLDFKSVHFKTDAGTGTTYGVAADSEGNGYWAQMAIDIVGKSDIATGKSLEIQIPPRREKMEIATEDERKLYAQSGSDWNSAIPWTQGPRRLGGDHTGNAVWVADWWGDNLAKIDIHTNKVTQYPAPSKDSGPYAVVVDKNHTVWVNMTLNDSVAKFDPTTEKWTEYMLPTHGAETRHIAVLDRQYPPTVVVPYWRTSKVARLQFRSKKELLALKQQFQGERIQAQNR